MEFSLKDHTVLLAVGGSRAYGMHTETSDVDIKGVAVPPKDYFLGCDKHFEQADGQGHMDVFLDLFDDDEEEMEAIEREKLEGVVYDIRKFMKLAMEANPNILDVLFCRDQEVRFADEIGQELRDNRELFLSAKAKHTFSGYAMAQLKRIRLHRRWLLNPPKGRPQREDYDLFPGIEANQVKAALAAVEKVIDGWELDLSRLEKAERIPIMNGVSEFMAELSVTEDDKWKAAARSIGYSDNFLVILEKERAFKRAVEDWKKFEQWKKNRNPARAALEAKSGFDTKHAAHLVRLLRMSREILETGKVNVWRGDIDRDDLLAIRAGAWDYDQLVEWAEQEDKEQQAIYKAKKYALPHKPDRKALHSLCIKLVEQSFSLDATGSVS